MAQNGDEAPKLQPVVAIAATHLPHAPDGDESWIRFGSLANPAYLWLKRGDGTPVTEVKVVYGDEAPADGWVKVPEDLNSNSVRPDRKKVFIHYRLGGEGSPILDLKIYTTHDPIVGPGFARLEEVLNPEADARTAKEHLCYKTVASQAKLDAAEYKVGDMVDCEDTARNWCQAQIMDVKGDLVLIHYIGWSEKWDEWIDRRSKRIQPYRSKTLGRATGWEGDWEAYMLQEKQAEFLEVFNKTCELVARLESGEFREYSREELSYLVTQNLQFVLNCLNCICDDPQLLQKVYQFFEKNLFLSVQYLKNTADVPQQFVEAIVKIFKGDAHYNRFYTKYGVKGGEPNLRGKFAQRPPTQVPGEDKLLTSAYLVWLINYFGEIGGFEAIAARLHDPKFEKDSYFNTALMIKSLAVIRGLLTPEFGPAYVKSLNLPAVLPRVIRRITDNELKTITKDSIKDLVRDCELLLCMKGSLYKQAEVVQLVEHINLDIALRLLTAKVLEKRLNGCNELEDVIKRVLRKERPSAFPIAAPPTTAYGVGLYGYQQQAAVVAEPQPAQFLSSEYLIKWIEENQVVDIMLGPGSHEQIIKRSPGVLKFLASNGALTVHHIDMLWASSIDKHEGLVRIVYDTLADLAQELNDEQLDALFARISALTLSDLTDYHLDFIKKFTVSAVKATKHQDKWFGMDVFWRILQDDSKVSPAISQHAAQILRELLEQPLFESQRLVYLEKCVHNVTAGTSVVPSLRLAKTVIAMYPPQPPQGISADKVITVGRLIAHLHTHYGIVNAVLNDLVRYNALAHKAVAAAEGKQKERKEKDVLVGGTAHFSVNLQTRLDFLDFLVSCSDAIKIDQAAIDTLWTVFVSNAVTSEDKTLLLNWLCAVVTDDQSRRPFPAFASPAVTRYLFTDYLANPAKMDFANLSKLGYECLETYFIQVNFEAGALLNTSPKFLAVGDFHKLAGLEALWQVVGTVQDAEVAAQAKRFLTTVYIKLNYEYSAAEKKAIFKSFIDHSMQLLAAAAKAIQAGAADAEAHKHRAAAVIEALDLFLERCQNGETIEEPKFKEGEPVRAIWKGNGRIYPGKIYKINRDGTYFVRFDDGDIDPAIPEANIFGPGGERVEGKPRPDSSETNLYPKLLLSNEKAYFDLLFELLGAGGELSPKVWKLLERLPTNQDLARKITALDVKDAAGKTDWNVLLPAGRIIKLLYSLQIVDSNLQVQEGDEAHRKEVQEWTHAFLTQGGFAHVYNILASADARSMVGEPLQLRCLLYLVKLVNTFVAPTAGPDAEVALKQIDLPRLVGRLLHVIAATAEVKTTPPPPPPKPAAPAPPRSVSPARGRVVGPMRKGEELFSSVHLTLILFLAAPGTNAAAAAEGENEHGAGAQAPPEDPTSQLVSQAFSLLGVLLGHKQEALEVVYAFDGWKDAISAALIHNHNVALRRAFQQGIMNICLKFQAIDKPKPPRVHFLPVLLQCLPALTGTSSASGPVHCTDFFRLLSVQLKFSKPEDGSFNPRALSEQLVTSIKERPIVEKRVSGEHDTVLSGLLELAKALASKHPELKEYMGCQLGLVEEVFHCLFDLPATSTKGKTAPPKCKAASTRKCAFQLLEELAKDCPANRAKLTALLLPNHLVSHSGGKNPDEWNFEAKYEEKSETGYVGLKNLGCICYMNALIQQLFMLPELRERILSIELDEKKDPDPKESVLYQLQYILANLQESEKQYCNPEGFCYAFKDFDGKPTNVSVQEDAAGFFTRLLDKLDEMIKGTPYQDWIKELLGGTFAHEFIGKGCPHYKEREEEFYTVQLPVQNKKTIEEALQAFVQGEMLEGDNAYKCGVCNKKVDTLKRTCLKNLPPTIAFVLKRFELDYNTLQTIKLNNRLEFPMELDLKPYCKESLPHPFQNQQQQAANGEGKAEEGKGENAGKPEPPVVRPDEYYKYELRGIVVHTGSASHGHYYSFIRERLEDEDGNPLPGRWFEFNDTIVRPFDPTDIPNECFGGTETYHGRGRMGAAAAFEKSRSAYVLFYDRVKPKSAAQKPKQEKKAPSKILQEIWQQNLTYWRDKAVFDKDYFEFLGKLLGGEQKEGEEEVDDETLGAPAVTLSGPLRPECSDEVKLATLFVMNTLTRSAQKQQKPQQQEPFFTTWVSLLYRMYHKNPNAAAWLLDMFTQTKWTQEFLLGCTDQDVRLFIGDFLCRIVSLLSPLEQASYDLPPPGENQPDNRGFVVRFIDGMVRLLRYVPESWRYFEPYWKVLSHFASLGAKEAQYLHHHNLLAKLIDLYLGDDSPNHDNSEFPVDKRGKRKPMGSAYEPLDVTYILQLMRALVCSVAISQEQLAGGTPPALAELPKGASVKVLSPAAHSMLHHRAFISRLLLEATSRRKGRAVVDILSHMCWENERFSQALIGSVAQAIEQAAYDQLRPLFRVLTGLLLIVDSLQERRADMILTSLLAVMKAQARYWKVIDFCTDHLIRFAKKSELAYKWLYDHQDKFDWLLRWMQANPKPPSPYDTTSQVILYKPGKGPAVAERTAYAPGVQYGHQYGATAGYTTAATAAAYQPGLYEWYGLKPRRKFETLQAIKEGLELDQDDASDSDVDLQDREFEVGQWVDALDTAGKWLCAQVIEVRKDTIRVHYDGWDHKWNQTFEKSSPNVQPLGSKTHPQDWKMRGKINPKR